MVKKKAPRENIGHPPIQGGEENLVADRTPVSGRVFVRVRTPDERKYKNASVLQWPNSYVAERGAGRVILGREKKKEPI